MGGNLTAVMMRTPGCRCQGQKPAHRQVAMWARAGVEVVRGKLQGGGSESGGDPVQGGQTSPVRQRSAECSGPGEQVPNSRWGHQEEALIAEAWRALSVCRMEKDYRERSGEEEEGAGGWAGGVRVEGHREGCPDAGKAASTPGRSGAKAATGQRERNPNAQTTYNASETGLRCHQAASRRYPASRRRPSTGNLSGCVVCQQHGPGSQREHLITAWERQGMP